MTTKEEIKSLLVGLGDIAVDIKHVMADGKVDLSDLSVLKDLISQRDELIAAVSGLGQIKLAELSGADISEIVATLAEVGAKVAAA